MCNILRLTGVSNNWMFNLNEMGTPGVNIFSGNEITGRSAVDNNLEVGRGLKNRVCITGDGTND